jgi:hypothetical protein
MSLRSRLLAPRTLGLAALLLACLAAVLALPAGATVGSTNARGKAASSALLGGINIESLSNGSIATSTDRAVATAAQLHAKVIRYSLDWSAVQPKGPGTIDPTGIATVDRVVDDAAALHIGVILTLGETPCWASSAPRSVLRTCTARNPGHAGAWPPHNPEDFANFAALIATRYGSKLAALEIWNEPDQRNEDYLAGPEKPRRYTELVRAAYPAIKRVDPSMTVLAGSFVGSNGAFLRALYAAGMKGYYDGLSVHFYTLTIAALRAIHEVQLANHDTTPLWLNEFGWSSCYPSHKTEQEQLCVTPQVQAANLTNTFRALARTPYVAAALVYKLQDSSDESFGMLTPRGVHKPSFAALSNVLASPFGPLSPVVLHLRQAGGRVIASGSAPVGDFMELEASVHGKLRYRDIFKLNRLNGYSIALPAVLGSSGLEVKVFQYGAGPGQAAQQGI